MADKQRLRDELLRVLAPEACCRGRLRTGRASKATARWTSREGAGVMRQLLDQWGPTPSSPAFLLLSAQTWPAALRQGASVGPQGDWTKATLPPGSNSIMEGIRRPGALLGLGRWPCAGGLRETPTLL